MKLSGVMGLCLVCLCGYAQEKPFISDVSLGVGQSRDSIDIYRLGVRRDTDCHWLSNPTGWLSLYCEASLNYWKKGGDDLYAAAFSPVFIYYFGDPGNSFHPYIEGGIGAAGISETEIAGRNLSTGFQFEDRIGAGIRMKRADLNFRYMHYSNGSIVQPNDGIDIFILTVSYRL